MTIRFRKYRNKSGFVVAALPLKASNVAEVVAYINKNGGTALDESKTFKNEHLKGGEYTAVKLALVQPVFHSPSGRYYKATRKAFGGDVIVREQKDDKSYVFYRVKASDFDEYAAV